MGDQSGVESPLRRIRIRMFLLLPLAFLSSSVSGHGGVLWPPVWQDGVGRPIEELSGHIVMSEPRVRDPNSGVRVRSTKSWLTDQAYTGGVGDEFKGLGPVTNLNNPNARKFDQCRDRCAANTNPWAAPGQAPSLGGGCGIFGGNPDGCPAHKDSRPPGSVCGQEEPLGRGKRGTTSFGTDARLVEFPQMITTEWEIGSVQEVAFHTRGSHKGGYTYRLCKLPEKGRIGITEECFTRHVLEFATNFTMIKAHAKNSTGVWEKLEQTDLREGTFPCGSVWRPIGKVVKKYFVIRKDSVVVPAHLTPGEYALSLRWDVAGGNQVWVSCASVRLVGDDSVGADEDEEEYSSEEEEEEDPIYT